MPSTVHRYKYPAEFYVGQQNKHGERHGEGEQHWMNNEFVRDKLHGVGRYSWRYVVEEHNTLACRTFEGPLYTQQMEGFGTMSYDDGRVFWGLHHASRRYGPGVVRYPGGRADAGLWRGALLTRLAWRPRRLVPTLAPAPHYFARLAPFKTVLAVDPSAAYACQGADEDERLLESVGAAGDECAPPRHALASRLAHAACARRSCPHFDGSLFDTTFYRDQPPLKVPEHMLTWNNSADVVSVMRLSHAHARGAARASTAALAGGARAAWGAPGPCELAARTLLLLAARGERARVAALVAGRAAHVDLADSWGNTALAYAATREEVATVRTLLQLGAAVDRPNDECVTPLALALLRYAARRVRAADAQWPLLFLPPDPQDDDDGDQAQEWCCDRQFDGVLSANKSHNRKQKLTLKSSISMASRPDPSSSKHLQRTMKKASQKNIIKSLPRLTSGELQGDVPYPGDASELKEYERLLRQVEAGGGESPLEVSPRAPESTGYVFDVPDLLMLFAASSSAETDAKSPSTGKAKTAQKDKQKKTSKTPVTCTAAGDGSSLDSDLQSSLVTIETLIDTLLEWGADPAATRCPQPALAIALFTDSRSIVEKLIKAGADVNETMGRIRNYTPLFIVLARNISKDTLGILEVLLRHGADPNQRLQLTSGILVNELEGSQGASTITIFLGPTPLHIVLMKTDGLGEECNLHEDATNMLLKYGIDASLQYLGKSGVDYACGLPSVPLLKIFIESPCVDTNMVVNRQGETLLAKMLTTGIKNINAAGRIELLKLLFEHGANPLSSLNINSIVYPNVIVYALMEIEKFKEITMEKPVKKGVSKTKITKAVKPAKAKNGTATYKPEDLLETLENLLQITMDYSRNQHVRWLRGKCFRQLYSVVYRLNHRSWHLIAEIKGIEQFCIWLTIQSALRISSIWNKLKNDKVDANVLKKILCIVLLYLNHPNMEYKINFQEKEEIENNITSAMNIDKKITEPDAYVLSQWIPELDEMDSNYNICLECSLPVTEYSTMCHECKLVYFCDEKCLRLNAERVDLHPCIFKMKK